MDRTLGDFVRVLRGVGVRISTSETIDAYRAVTMVGYADRATLKSSLSMTLAKTSEEHELFDGCFDRFFAFQKLSLYDDESPTGAPDGPIDPTEQSAQEGGGSGDGGGGGGGGDGQGDGQGQGESQASSPLGQLLLSGDQSAFDAEMAQAGKVVGVSEVRAFTQNGRFTRKIVGAMGLEDLDAEIAERLAGDDDDLQLAVRLEQGRERLFETVKDYVEQQIALFGMAEGKEFRRAYLPRIKLSNVERRNVKEMRELVRKMAKRLVALNSRRRRVTKRGQLDVRRTMRASLPHGGLMFNTHWKSTKVDRPKIFAVCDVSGSVSTVSRFLLMFLYSVNEVLPRVRSFAFSGRLGEVTDLFDEHDLEEAVAIAMQRFGDMSTDYGRSFVDLSNLCIDEIDSRSTVIILGDGRSNYGNPRADILKIIYNRARQVIWLNPEPRNLWTLGDAEMARLTPYCHRAEVCNTLVHLERVVSDLLRSTI